MLYIVCRYVELHSQAGRYYRLRIPVFGRDMLYQPDSADLMFVGSSSQLYRLNLEQGRFMAPYALSTPTGGNVIIHNEGRQAGTFREDHFPPSFVD